MLNLNLRISRSLPCIIMVMILAMPKFGSTQVDKIIIRSALDSTAIRRADMLLEAKLQSAGRHEFIAVNIVTRNAFLLQKQITSAYPVTSGNFHALPGLLTCSLTVNTIKSLRHWDNVDHISLVGVAVVEMKSEGYDYSLAGVNYLHHQKGFLRGDGQTISIKEQAFNGDDIDLTGRRIWTPVTPSVTGQHATLMASIAAGAPNSDPYALGVAPHALITSADFTMLAPDPDSIFKSYDISIQNHSYGSTSPENYYGPEAMAYDAAAVRLPGLLHVFSSGNRGAMAAETGMPYAGLIGWANLTGTYKQSKNTLCIGAVDSFRNVYPYSSAGPAHDGRIKPELVAYSRDGTSGAAAMISGMASLVQQAHTYYHGTSPASALVRAALINTAQDIHAPGPDFRTGYGLIRPYDAVRLMEEARFAVDTIRHGQQHDLLIPVEAGLHALRVTLSWTDPAAPAFYAKALINDLDLQVVRISDGEVFYPYVLNHAMHLDSLAQAARSGIDTINNNEHIVIQSPDPGLYRIRISAASINTLQEYAIVWSADTVGQFRWMYPTATDIPEAGRRTGIRWETVEDTEGEIEYKWAGSAQWIGQASVLTGEQYAGWTWPDSSGLMQLRLRTRDDEYVSDTFLVSVQPRLHVGYICGDSMLVHWAPVPGADRYQLLRLGELRLMPYVSSVDTMAIVSSTLPKDYVAVTPVFGERTGMNSPTIRFRNQGAGCYIDQFFLHHLEDSVAVLQVDLGWLEGISALRLERQVHGGYHAEVTISPVTTFSHQIMSFALQQGINIFRLVAVLDDGRLIASDAEYVYFAGGQDILLFPNPVSGNESIRTFVKKAEPFDLELYDMTGRLLYKVVEASNPDVIPAQLLPGGVYVVMARFEDGKVVAGKVVIE